MKKFYTMIAQQPISKSLYGDGNHKLYTACSQAIYMPLIVTLCNEIQGKESFHVLAMDSFQNDSSNKNITLLKEELEAYFPGQYTLDILEAPVEISSNGQIALFKKIYGTFAENDEIYFDITFGYKLIPMTVLIACNYAKKFVKGVRIRKLVYAVYDFSKKEDAAYVHRIHDVTSLVYLNDFIDKMAAFETSDPTALIDQLFTISDQEM